MDTVANGTDILKHQIDRMSNTKNSSQNVNEAISALSKNQMKLEKL